MTEKQAKVTKYIVLQNDITVKFTTNRTYRLLVHRVEDAEFAIFCRRMGTSTYPVHDHDRFYSLCSDMLGSYSCHRYRG